MIPFNQEAAIQNAYNQQILNGANAKVLAAIANATRRAAFENQGIERAAPIAGPADYLNLGRSPLNMYDSGAYDFSLSSLESVPQTHRLVSKLVDQEDIIDPVDKAALLQLLKMSTTDFARIYPAEYDRLVRANIIIPPPPAPEREVVGGGVIPGQTQLGVLARGVETTRDILGEVAGALIPSAEPGAYPTLRPGEGGEISPEQFAGGEAGEGFGGLGYIQGTTRVPRSMQTQMRNYLNPSRLSDATNEVVTVVDQTGSELPSYSEWRLQMSKPTGSQSEAEYQWYLLEHSYNANINSKVDNPDDLVYFTWDPKNPSAPPKPVTGEEDIREIDATVADELRLQVDQEGGFAATPIGATSAFARNAFSTSEYGQKLTADVTARFDELGITTPADQILWTVNRGNLQMIPNLDPEGQVFGGIDWNSITNDEFNQLVNRLDRAYGIPEELQPLIDEFQTNPTETNRSLLGIVLQEEGLANVTTAEFLNTNVAEYFQPADYSFDVNVAQGWADPSGWAPVDGTGATYQAVRAGALHTPNYQFVNPNIPDNVPEATQAAPGIQGFRMNVAYETGVKTYNTIAEMGGDPDTWASPEMLAHLYQTAANRDIPNQVALAYLHSRTDGYTLTMTPTEAQNLVTEELDRLSASMLRYGNPALAVIDQLLPDTASTLNTVGWLDANHAALTSDVYGQFMAIANLFPGAWDSTYFQTAQKMLALNSQLASDRSLTVEHADPLRVKDAMRDAFDALLMPYEDATLDAFAKQFRAAETAAYQPLTNSYNRTVSESQEFWQSLNASVTPNVGSYEWIFPIAGQARYSNDFGADRVGHDHGGIDILADEGTAIVAPVAGKVVSVGSATGNDGGNRIHILGNDGIRYYFAHNQYNLVKVGDAVTAGQTIGTVGRTGNAWKGGTGAPHVHFEMHGNGQWNSQSYNVGHDGRVNPYGYLQAAERQGATIVSPWDTNKWQGAGIEDARRAAAEAANMQFIDVTRPDFQAQARQLARDNPIYEDLYGEKPVGISDVDYAAAFAGTAATLTGTPAPEAARIGAATNSMDALYGSLLADTDMQDTSTQFRGRLFNISDAFTRAMGGRP